VNDPTGYAPDGPLAEVISWRWKKQPDLDQLGEAIRRVSGGACDLRLVDTDSDTYDVVIADHVMTEGEARELWAARFFEDEEDREQMRAYWARRDAGSADG